MSEIAKVIDIFDAIGASPTDVFDSLSTSQRLMLASEIRKAKPTGSPDSEISALIAAFNEFNAGRGGAMDIPIFDKLMFAAQLRKLTTAGIVAGSPNDTVIGVAATATLTIGGETDSDLEEGDIITIGGIELKAAAADADVSSYEFNIATDKADVADNIFACINAIPGNIVLPWTCTQIDDTIRISARATGTAGNSIEVSVTTDGDTAFSSETLVGGIDAVEKDHGTFMVDANGKLHAKINGTWVGLLSEYTMPNGGALPEGLLPDVLHIETGTITDDIEAEPLVIEAPDGYDLEKLTLVTNDLEDPLTTLNVADENGDVIAQDGSYVGNGKYFFYPIASAVHVQGELTLSLADNTTPGFSAVFSFRKSRA